MTTHTFPPTPSTPWLRPAGADTTTLTIWRDGRYETVVKEEAASFEAGLHYGAGVFEGIRCYATPQGPAIFRLDDHMERMELGAAVMGFEIDTHAMAQAAVELIRTQGLTDAYIRPFAWMGGGALHLDLDVMTLRQAVLAMPWTSHLGEDAGDRGISMTVSPWKRNHREAIPPLKISGAYANACISKMEARRRGFDTALYTAGDTVVEATAENVFFVKDGRIVSARHPDALDGITRQTIVEMTGAEEREVTVEELREADEIFLTGTSCEVTPVTRFEDRILPAGPFTRAIQEDYLSVVQGRYLAYAHWLTRVDTTVRRRAVGAAK